MVNQRYYFESFWDYVKSGHYSDFIRHLQMVGKTPQEIREINHEIREIYLEELLVRYPILKKFYLDIDGYTIHINSETEILFRQMWPTFTKLMVGNHGVYVEMLKPQDKGTFIKHHLQYNEFNVGGVKFYEQYKTVNYADYKRNMWYASIHDFNLDKLCMSKSFRGQMFYDSKTKGHEFKGEFKRDGVVGDSTIQSIIDGQRTASTRYEFQGHLDYWKTVMIGDTIEWFGNNGESVITECTKPFHKLKGSGKSILDWCVLEGWSPLYFKMRVEPFLDEAWQIEYRFMPELQNENKISKEPINKSLF